MLYVLTMLGFMGLVPLYTYLLLVLKGLPAFAVSHQIDVLAWVYESTWLAALISGLLVSVVLSIVVKRTPYFHRPFDFGRCFSLGGIMGALADTPATWLHRSLSHRPYSDFWMAGASMAGFLAGATLIPLLLWYFAEQGEYPSQSI
jgi:hypothetical protein